MPPVVVVLVAVMASFCGILATRGCGLVRRMMGPCCCGGVSACGPCRSVKLLVCGDWKMEGSRCVPVWPDGLGSASGGGGSPGAGAGVGVVMAALVVVVPALVWVRD